ncbi:MAG: bifunctional transcriptional activator/DNA repair enzyme AdaA [Desulfuromonadales bacterium]
MNYSDYQRIEQAILYLEHHAVEHPSLDEIATYIGLSPSHFQRLFKRWAGVSPKRFLQHLRVTRAKELLSNSASVLDAALEVGLSGPGRLHDLFVSIDAVTPGEFKNSGENLELRYGFHQTPFGEGLAAMTSRGLCSFGFVEQGGREQALEALRESWHKAAFVQDPQASGPIINNIFKSDSSHKTEPIRILLRGTNFQLKVWEALLRIPEGAVVSYSALADAIGHPGASRAVGNAVGQNPIAYLIPCHRVLRASGGIGGYRWGTMRKKVLLATETACRLE